MMKGYLLWTNLSAKNKTRMLKWSLNWFSKQFQTKLEQHFRMNFGGLNKVWKYGGGREALQKHRSVRDRFWSRIHQRPISFHHISSSSSSSLQICRLRVWRGGCFRSHQYVPRHSRITNLLSSWELPNTAGNSPNVSNGEASNISFCVECQFYFFGYSDFLSVHTPHHKLFTNVFLESDSAAGIAATTKLF